MENEFKSMRRLISRKNGPLSGPGWIMLLSFCRMEREVIDSPLESANTGAFWKGLILKLHCPGVFKGWPGKCRPLVIVLMRSAYLWFLLGKPVCRNDMGNYKNAPTTPSHPLSLSIIPYTNPNWEGEKQSHSYKTPVVTLHPVLIVVSLFLVAVNFKT